MTELLAAAALLLTSSAAATTAWGHAFPEAEEPKVGSTILSPPTRVAITYDAPIESPFSNLKVLSAEGENQDAGAPLVINGKTLAVAVKPLRPGDYTVKWSVVAMDGHRTEGSFTFTVAARAQ